MRNLKLTFLLLTVAALSGCAVVQQIVEKPSVHVTDVKYKSISLREGELDSQLILGNPNSFGLPLKKMQYTLRLNNHQLAKSTVSFDRNIPAHGNTRVRLPIRFQYRSLLNGLENLLQQKHIHYQLTGNLDFGLVSVAFSKSGDFVLRP